MKTIRVMIVDDHLIVREGLRQLLELESDIEVVAEAGSGLECLALLDETCPHLIFMDVRMPGISGIETTRLVRRKCPQTRIVILTIHEEDQFVTEAIEAGARGYALKNIKREELIRIVRDVMEDRAFLDPAVASRLFDHVRQAGGKPEPSGQPDLTRRELEVLKWMVGGRKDKDISDLLHISGHTVRSHIKSLYRKLGVSSRSQAVAKAIRDGIISQ